MRRTVLYTLILSLIFGYGVSFAQTESVSYKHQSVRGHSVDVVKADLKDPKISITPVVSTNFPHVPEYFGDMVERTDPVAAINGNFFCKRTYKPVGDIVIDGKLVYFGGIGTAMAITKHNKVEFIKVEKYRHMNWSDYKTVISCGPQLLADGKIILDPRSEGFKDPNLYGKRNRSAVGITWDNNILFVTVNDGIYFQELAEVMKALGCKDAMNLDGGGSSGLYYKGETIVNPRTPMPDILVVQEREFAPNFLVSLREKMIKGETRVDVLSSVAMVINKDKFLVKGVKDGKVFMVVRFENPNMFELPQIGAKVTSNQNKLTFTIPIDKIKDIINNN